MGVRSEVRQKRTKFHSGDQGHDEVPPRQELSVETSVHIQSFGVVSQKKILSIGDFTRRHDTTSQATKPEKKYFSFEREKRVSLKLGLNIAVTRDYR